MIHIEPYERILNRDYKGLKGKKELGISDLKQHLAEVEKLAHDLGSVHRFWAVVAKGGLKGSK